MTGQLRGAKIDWLSSRTQIDIFPFPEDVSISSAQFRSGEESRDMIPFGCPPTIRAQRTN
jgi:hypothetical protein